MMIGGSKYATCTTTTTTPPFPQQIGPVEDNPQLPKRPVLTVATSKIWVLCLFA